MALTDLLLLGQNSDLSSERGVSCDGALPTPSDPSLLERAVAAKNSLGSRAMILGHHYQRDEVIQFADITGDSFKLAQTLNPAGRCFANTWDGHCLPPRWCAQACWIRA